MNASIKMSICTVFLALMMTALNSCSRNPVDPATNPIDVQKLDEMSQGKMDSCADATRSNSLLRVGSGGTNSAVLATSITVLKQVNISGSSYFLTLEKLSNGKSDVWARKSPNSSTAGDVHILKIQTTLDNAKQDAMSLICRANSAYSTASTIVGCGATIGSGVCIYTGGGAGFAVPVCAATIEYTITTGFIDCVSGLADVVGNHFGYSDFGIMVQTNYGKMTVSSFVSTAISVACDDWKNNNPVSKVPSTPATKPATNVTGTSFSANWNSVNGATGYYVDVATNSSFTNFVGGYNNRNVGNVTTCSVTGLTATTTYFYRVRASNGAGTSGNSGVITVQTLMKAPSAPSANSATNITATSFSANWNSVNWATSYYLDVATNSSFTNFVSGYNNKNVGNVTTSSVTGLTATTTYFYRVRASNTAGTSGNSSVIGVQTLMKSPPASVTKSATNITSTGFSANWNSVIGATTYYLDVATNSSFTNFVSGYNNKNVGNVATSPVTGLTASTMYYYRVRASNASGTSGNSNVIGVQTPTKPPSAPTTRSATNTTATSFSANWNSVSGATGYYLDVATNSSFTNFVSGYNNRNVGNFTTGFVGGLKANTGYYYRVRAFNNTGTSSSSSTIAVVTKRN